MTVAFKWTLGSIVLRDFEMFVLVWDIEKEIICIENIYKMDYAETNYGFPQFHLPLALIKQRSFCLCFRRGTVFFRIV